MATNKQTNTSNHKQLTQGPATAQALALNAVHAVATTAAALAPSMAPAPVTPATLPLANYTIAGVPSTAKQATNGVGPAPKAGTVGHAAIACIAAGGASMATVQAAVTAVGLKGKHPALALLRWLAANRGYTFVCTNGVLSMPGA